MKNILLITFALVSSNLLLAQNQNLPQTLSPQERMQSVRIQDILVEEEAFESEIEIRLPETALMPRRETDEIRFTLSFIRQRFIESNRLLY